MKRLLMAGLLAQLLASGAAQACTCVPQTAEEIALGSTLVFIGTVKMPQPDSLPGRAYFELLSEVKGGRYINPHILPNRPGADESCKAEFTIGEKYAVVTQGTYLDGYYTDKCIVAQLADSKFADEVGRQILLQNLKRQQIPRSVYPEDLVAMRALAKFYLDSHSPEVAEGVYRAAAEISRGSVIDEAGRGESFLLLGMGRDALTAFDNVLEKEANNEQAWWGRYRALALLNRWSELPPSKALLNNIELRYTTLSADLDQPIFKYVWWYVVDASARKFPGANFTEARLVGVNFSKADLAKADFTKAVLRDVDFTGANLAGANFTGTVLKNIKWPAGFTPPKSLTDK